MSNAKTYFQVLMERLASDPALKDKALSATPEQFLAMCQENGLKELTLDKAKTLQQKLKTAFASEGAISEDQLAEVAGGAYCDQVPLRDVFFC